MKKLKTLIAVLAIFTISIIANAQETNQIPSYRHQGYMGNVSISDLHFYFIGLDTSHGYMFNEHHYLGAGVEACISVPVMEDLWVFMVEPFVEYKAFFLKRKSTPTASMRAGYAYGNTYITDPELSFLSFAFDGHELALTPSLGWDWGMKNGKGLNLSVGALIMTDFKTIFATPKISFGFNF